MLCSSGTYNIGNKSSCIIIFNLFSTQAYFTIQCLTHLLHKRLSTCRLSSCSHGVVPPPDLAVWGDTQHSYSWLNTRHEQPCRVALCAGQVDYLPVPVEVNLCCVEGNLPYSGAQINHMLLRISGWGLLVGPTGHIAALFLTNLVRTG